MDIRRVVNIRDYPSGLPEDVAYCGRRTRDDPGPYGNPFVIGRDGNRDQVIAKWGVELTRRLQDPAYERQFIQDLDRKHLGCFCAPQPCHCDLTIREVAKRSRSPELYGNLGQSAEPRTRDVSAEDAAARMALIRGDDLAKPVGTPKLLRLAIIGTAGRKEDAAHMSTALQERMGQAARAVVRAKGFTALVSGGAAWADHVAVQLALDGTVQPEKLRLHLPAQLGPKGFSEDTRDGGVANYYHRLFREKTGIDGLAELHEVIARGAEWKVNPDGFKARNTDVARDADGVLAFTFGPGEPWKAKVHGNVTAAAAMVKDGGTSDTWNKSGAVTKIHVTLAPIVEQRPASRIGVGPAPSAPSMRKSSAKEGAGIG